MAASPPRRAALHSPRPRNATLTGKRHCGWRRATLAVLTAAPGRRGCEHGAFRPARPGLLLPGPAGRRRLVLSPHARRGRGGKADCHARGDSDQRTSVLGTSAARLRVRRQGPLAAHGLTEQVVHEDLNDEGIQVKWEHVGRLLSNCIYYLLLLIYYLSFVCLLVCLYIYIFY